MGKPSPHEASRREYFAAAQSRQRKFDHYSQRTLCGSLMVYDERLGGVRNIEGSGKDDALQFCKRYSKDIKNIGSHNTWIKVFRALVELELGNKMSCFHGDPVLESILKKQHYPCAINECKAPSSSDGGHCVFENDDGLFLVPLCSYHNPAKLPASFLRNLYRLVKPDTLVAKLYHADDEDS